MKREQGTIKWLKGDRGIGFILPVTGGADVFLHISVCREHGIVPTTGMNVEFEAVDGLKGRKAVWVGEKDLT